MTDPRDTRASAEPSPREQELPPPPGRTRGGYVPRGEDSEPDQAPTGAASPSTPAPDDD
ncbi:MAG: hypothetical protein ACRDS1_15850 [Pseudonocardiaceae bacterium]